MEPEIVPAACGSSDEASIFPRFYHHRCGNYKRLAWWSIVKLRREAKLESLWETAKLLVGAAGVIGYDFGSDSTLEMLSYRKPLCLDSNGTSMKKESNACSKKPLLIRSAAMMRSGIT